MDITRQQFNVDDFLGGIYLCFFLDLVSLIKKKLEEIFQKGLTRFVQVSLDDVMKIKIMFHILLVCFLTSIKISNYNIDNIS